MNVVAWGLGPNVVLDCSQGIARAFVVAAGNDDNPPAGTFEFLGFPVNLLISNGVPDAIPPTVAITSPADGAVLTRAFALSANATDNVVVVGVQFFIDGAPFGTEDKAAPYTRSVPRGTLAAGTHTLSAVARDNAGNTATAAVTVTVQ